MTGSLKSYYKNEKEKTNLDFYVVDARFLEFSFASVLPQAVFGVPLSADLSFGELVEVHLFPTTVETVTRFIGGKKRKNRDREVKLYSRQHQLNCLYVANT